MDVTDILLLLEARERGAATTRYALALARRVQAHVAAVAMILDPAPPSSVVTDFPYDAVAEIMRQSRIDAEALYKSDVAATGIASDFHVIEAVPGEARARFAEMARCYDLTIMRQPDRGAPTDDERLAEAVLFGSGRCALLVPYAHDGEAKFDRALVAWDGGRPAARALSEALPLLRCAEQVEVVSARSSAEGETPPYAEAVRHLARHGVAATGRLLPGGRNVGAILLSYAADYGADYLVMGAYGHSRMREVILGGVTRAILKSMTVPVLTAH